MDLNSINAVENHLDYIWNQVSMHWKDQYQREFENKAINEMKEIISEIRNVLSETIYSFEEYKQEQDNLKSIVENYKGIESIQ